MRLVFHPEVYSDVDAIMRYYEQVATPGGKRNRITSKLYCDFVVSNVTLMLLLAMGFRQQDQTPQENVACYCLELRYVPMNI